MQSVGMVFGRLQQQRYFSTFIARELRTEDVNTFQASKDESLETIILAICISINPLYSSDSFMSIFLNTEDSNEMAYNAAFYQCLHRLIFREINIIWCTSFWFAPCFLPHVGYFCIFWCSFGHMYEGLDGGGGLVFTIH